MAETDEEHRGDFGKTIAIVAVVSGIALAVAGTAVILGTRGLEPDDVAEDPAQLGPQSVDMAGYERSCRTDAQCVVVMPDRCTPCACSPTAIARTQLERFNHAAARLRCRPQRPGTVASCAPCVVGSAACIEGACTLAAR